MQCYPCGVGFIGTGGIKAVHTFVLFKGIKGQIKESVRGSVKETLNGLPGNSTMQ